MKFSARQSSLLVCTMASLLLAGCTGAEARHTQHMKRGQEYFEAGNFDKARVEFGNALQIKPNDAQARYMSGRVAESLGNVRDAAAAYQGAIDIDPELVPARSNLGRVYVLAGLPDNALAIIEPVMAKHPDDADLLTVRGAARQQQGKREEALADAEHAVKVDPVNELAVSLLASLYMQSPQPERAVVLLKATLEKVPKSVDLRQVLASVYLGSKERDLAEEQLSKLVALQPQRADLRNQLALLYTQDHNPEAAEKLLRDGIALQPTSDELKLSYADWLTAQRSPEAGETTLKDYIAKSPEDYALQLGLGGLQERRRDTKAAMATYEGIVAKDKDGPKGLAARVRMATIDLREGRVQAAAQRVTEVLTKNPRDNEALVLRGEMALQRNDPASAITDLRTVLRDQPDAVGIMRVLARAHVANGEPALAEENLRKAMVLAPRDPGLRTELAQSLLQSRQIPQAVALLEETVRIAPTDPSAREGLTRAYIAANELEKARVAAEDLKTLRPDLAVGPFLAGLIALQQNRVADGERDLQKSIDLQPAALDPLQALVQLDLVRGKPDAAIQRVTAYVTRQPTVAEGQSLLGELYYSKKDYPAAQKQFATAIELAPKWAVPRRNLARAQLGAGDAAAAMKTLEAGIEATSYEPSLVSDLASLYETKGRPDDAIKLYDALLAKRSHQELAENNLAMLLVSYRKDPQSLDRARDLSARFADSTNPALLDTYGWVQLRRGDAATAMRALERAASLAPKSPLLAYHLGLAQLQAGQRDRARESLQRAVDAKADFSGLDDARVTLATLNKKAG